MSHYNLLHEPNPMTPAIKNSEVAAFDKEWDETRMKSEKEIIEQAQTRMEDCPLRYVYGCMSSHKFCREWLALMRFGRSFFCAGGVRCGRRPKSLESSSTTFVSQETQKSLHQVCEREQGIKLNAISAGPHVVGKRVLVTRKDFERWC